MFFDSWSGLVRVLVVGTLAYAGLVLLLRVSGKRTLAKMNAFDLVVTVALGSTLATITLTEDVALFEGMLAFVTLVALQFIVAWLSVRSATVRNLVKSEPALLARRGELLHGAMRRERVTVDEIRAAVREEGLPSLDVAEAVILETDGSFSVVRRADDEGRRLTALTGVSGWRAGDDASSREDAPT